ncbi:hypothetical protein KC19_8G086700, partial [Ceratodon purpureus]
MTTSPSAVQALHTPHSTLHVLSLNSRSKPLQCRQPPLHPTTRRTPLNHHRHRSGRSEATNMNLPASATSQYSKPSINQNPCTDSHPTFSRQQVETPSTTKHETGADRLHGLMCRL